MSTSSPDPILRCRDLAPDALAALVARHGLALRWVADGAPLPGSYWGEPEAGLVRGDVWVRGDTLLHELAHVVCMDPARRAALDRDAGGDDLEESAVCCLQLLLADALADVDRDRVARGMDAWGYSFRFGSTGAWFARDAADARRWLERHGLVAGGLPTWRLRGALDASGSD